MKPFKAALTFFYECSNCSTTYPFDFEEVKNNKVFQCHCGDSIKIDGIESVKIIPTYKGQTDKNVKVNVISDIIEQAAKQLKPLGYKKAEVARIIYQINPLPNNLDDIIKEILKCKLQTS